VPMSYLVYGIGGPDFCIPPLAIQFVPEVLTRCTTPVVLMKRKWLFCCLKVPSVAEWKRLLRQLPLEFRGGSNSLYGASVFIVLNLQEYVNANGAMRGMIVRTNEYIY
jgi:hypothetical protein